MNHSMHIFYYSYLHVTYTYIESRMINKNINNMFNIDDNNNNNIMYTEQQISKLE